MVGWPGAAQDRLPADVRRVLGLAVLMFRGDRAKDAELLVLRHENAVLRRHAGRVRYEPADRVWFAALARLLPRRRWTEIFPVTPATLLAWHRKLAARKYDTSKPRKPGRPPIVPEHRSPCRPAGEGESAVGIPPDPRRADEARRDGRAVHGVGDPACCGHRSGAAPVRPDLAAVPACPGRRDPRRRLPARGHRAAQATVRPGVHRARYPPDAPGRRHLQPDRRVDGAAGPQPRPQPRRAVRGHAIPDPRPRIELHPLVRRRIRGRRDQDSAQRCPGAADERDLRTPRRHPAPRDSWTAC